MNRRFRLLLAALASATLLWLLLAAAERALLLAQRFLALPAWLQWTLGVVLALFAIAATMIAWNLLRPRRRPRRSRTVEAPTREHLDARLDRLETDGAGTESLRAELRDLDARGASGRFYVAVFGEISTGKSSLIAALAPNAALATDVRGGTTRRVHHVDAVLTDGSRITLADVPGTRETSGELREKMARDEALRAHVVIYLTDGDLNRSQGEELAWLADFGKPLVLALNKTDRLSREEREQVLDSLRRRAPQAAAVVAIRTGGSERFERRLVDGGSEIVERRAPVDVAPLIQTLEHLLHRSAQQLEPARERAVLARMDRDVHEAEAALRSKQAEAAVHRYARRAVIGAMAAVAPGSDLIIQGALATGLVRELCRIHDVAVSDVQIETFLKRTRMTVRTSASLVLAIAGNALKAFPGLGTLGGGVLHAFAYALIFDSLGKALSATLAERHALDAEAADERLKQWLGETGNTRLKRLAKLTVDAARSDEDATE
ncbi:GTPase [Oleiagrimonas sp. MCCC 1A03011]|uniref:GTPase n=1 Tax=Oleiagrimonas sp. MCCC 1A03011 TaxID=1926883 RepID=UPI000DC34820|nr:GTPase [Oleiagrimonas sp. MCCC 1A03011]RAP58474.1 GTP-binding protein HSR1 [Oleiagrimonas sp. MCCC 1A03011]